MPRRFDQARFDRFCARHAITRGHLVLIHVFLWGHPDESWVHALLAFTRGEGAAAVAAGRVTATAGA